MPMYKILNESILMCLKVRVAWRKADIPLLAAATHWAQGRQTRQNSGGVADLTKGGLLIF